MDTDGSESQLSFSYSRDHILIPLVSTSRPAGVPAQLRYIVGAGPGPCLDYDDSTTPRPSKLPAIAIPSDPTPLNQIAHFCVLDVAAPVGTVTVTLNDGNQVELLLKAIEPASASTDYRQIDYYPTPGDPVGVQTVAYHSNSGANAKSNFNLIRPSGPSLVLLPSRHSAVGKPVDIELGLFGFAPNQDQAVQVFAASGLGGGEKASYFGTYIVKTDATGAAGARFRTTVTASGETFDFTADAPERIAASDGVNLNSEAIVFVQPDGIIQGGVQ